MDHADLPGSETSVDLADTVKPKATRTVSRRALLQLFPTAVVSGALRPTTQLSPPPPTRLVAGRMTASTQTLSWLAS